MVRSPAEAEMRGMRTYILGAWLCAAFLFAGLRSCAEPLPVPQDDSSQDAVARIVGHSLTSDGAMKFLETLTDTIGGRITGSAGSREAADLILKTMKNAGTDRSGSKRLRLGRGRAPDRSKQAERDRSDCGLAEQRFVDGVCGNT